MPDRKTIKTADDNSNFMDDALGLNDNNNSSQDIISSLLDSFLRSDVATSGASSVLKTLNELYPEPPSDPLSEPIGFIGNKIVRAVDNAAERIGSQSGQQSRSLRAIKEGLSNEGAGYYGGIASRKAPNLLRMYLGLDENTLPVSQDVPTDFTKGTPSGGGRSIKEFSDEPTFQTSTASDDFVNRFREMNKAVKAGKYVPSEHIISSGEVSWLPVDMSTSVDLGGFTQSIGYDKDKGKYYYSVTDVWDFNPDEYSKKWADTGSEEDRAFIRGQARLMDAVGTGIGIYDRYYIPDDVVNKWVGQDKRKQ